MTPLASGRTQSTQTFFKYLLFSVVMISAGTTTATVVYAQTEERVVAVVNGRKITQNEVDKAIVAQLLPLEQQIYALRKISLENLIHKVIMEGEARKRGISVEELKRDFTGGSVQVQPDTIERAYVENRQAFGSMSEEEVKERLRLDFESEERMKNYRAALSKLKLSSRIELNLAEPVLPPDALSEENSPSTGNKEARIRIIEFSDFQCPFCKESQSTLKQVLQTYGTNVSLVFKHLPLEIHPQAFIAARAAFCAGEQNRFWPYHDALFAADNLTPETFNKIATDVGLDPPKFKACFASDYSRVAVLKDVQDAKRLGINGTPSFIINGTLVSGALSLKDFNEIIARKLKSFQ